MKNWYLFCRSELKKFIVRAFEILERDSDPGRIYISNRCIEILSILLDYVNLVVFINRRYGLKIQEKKRLDDSNSSSNKSAVTSTHLANGDQL